MTRLLIDCTGTYFSKLNTGIQRVVKEIIAHETIFHNYGFDEIDNVVQLGGNYCKLDNKDQLLPLLFTYILHYIAGKLRDVFDLLCKNKKNNNIINISAMSENLDNVNAGNKENSFYKRSLFVFRKILKRIFSITICLDKWLIPHAFVEFNDKDTLFLPDAFWYNNISMNTIKVAKQNGSHIIILFHDIIPLTHSNFMEDKNVLKFRTKYDQILPLIDGYICNSDFTVSEIVNYLSKYYPEFKNLPSGFAHLGCDLCMSKTVQSDLIKNTKDQQDTYLMVGTIEPRKNHDFVVSAFHKLWQEGFKVKLVIIGRIGWKNSNTIKEIMASPYKNQYLFMYNNLSDNKLIEFYSKCKVLIIASVIEGFGLPLVEAIYHKKLILASDIPIFREVGQSYPIFFDLRDENSLVNAIKNIEDGEILLDRCIPEMNTWEDCVNQIGWIMQNEIIR